MLSVTWAFGPPLGDESLPTVIPSGARWRSLFEDFAVIGTSNLLLLVFAVKSRFSGFWSPMPRSSESRAARAAERGERDSEDSPETPSGRGTGVL
jgi:hypothetical protein